MLFIIFILKFHYICLLTKLSNTKKFCGLKCLNDLLQMNRMTQLKTDNNFLFSRLKFFFALKNVLCVLLNQKKKQNVAQKNQKKKKSKLFHLFIILLILIFLLMKNKFFYFILHNFMFNNIY